VGKKELVAWHPMQLNGEKAPQNQRKNYDRGSSMYVQSLSLAKLIVKGCFEWFCACTPAQTRKLFKSAPCSKK